MSAKNSANSSSVPSNPVTDCTSAKNCSWLIWPVSKRTSRGGVVDEFLHFGGGHFAARRDSPSGDAIIKIHQHFAEIEDDCLGSGHDQWISRRPSSARLSVSSSTNSNPLPAGKPWAMREVFTDLVESRLAR